MYIALRNMKNNQLDVNCLSMNRTLINILTFFQTLGLNTFVNMSPPAVLNLSSLNPLLFRNSGSLISLLWMSSNLILT